MIITPARPTASDVADLLARAQTGDGEAFCTLARAHEQRLFQQAVALCGNLTVAEDLAADTLIQAWQSLARFNGRCRFSTWLYAILLHRHQKLIRQQRSRPVPLSALPADFARDQEQLLERLADDQSRAPDLVAHAETDAALRHALTALPTKHRQVLLLRFFEGAALADIAVALGVSVGTVKSRLHHGLAKLRRMQNVVNLSVSRRDTGV